MGRRGFFGSIAAPVVSALNVEPPPRVAPSPMDDYVPLWKPNHEGEHIVSIFQMNGEVFIATNMALYGPREYR